MLWANTSSLSIIHALSTDIFSYTFPCPVGLQHAIPPLLTEPPLSRYLLYPNITMNSHISFIDFYYLFTSVIRIFRLSGPNPFVPKHLDNRGCCTVYIWLRILGQLFFPIITWSLPMLPTAGCYTAYTGTCSQGHPVTATIAMNYGSVHP